MAKIINKVKKLMERWNEAAKLSYDEVVFVEMIKLN